MATYPYVSCTQPGCPLDRAVRDRHCARSHRRDNPVLFTTKLKAMLVAGACSAAALTGVVLAPTAADAAICPSASDGLGHSATLCVTATTSGIGGEVGETVAVSGTLTVYTPGCTVVPFAAANTGAGVNLAEFSPSITAETPISATLPKACVGTTCVGGLTTVSRYQIKLFTAPMAGTVDVDGIPVSPNIPTLCVSMAGTGCTVGFIGVDGSPFAFDVS